MSTQQVEVIDTSNMKILSEFEAEGEILENLHAFRFGVIREDVVLAAKDGNDNWRGDVLFERRHLKDVARGLDDLLTGRLVPQGNEFILEDGKDDIYIHPTMPRADLSISIGNTRRARMDSLETGGWQIHVSVETAKRMRDEMLKLVVQGV